MNGKNISLFLMSIGCLMIFSGCVSSFIIGLREDKEIVMARMVDVSNTFEDFSTEVSLYEEQRDLLYSQVLSNLYYENMYLEDKAIKNSLSNYESMVNEIDKKRVNLDVLCNEVYYPDGNINSKCINYRSIFEQVNNYFVADIDFYNKIVDEYNTYASSLENPNKVSKYKILRKYIDFNNDGKFDGREE